MAQRSRRAALGGALAGGGMATLCFGLRAEALLLFAVGVFFIERGWRQRHAEFRGGIAARWQAALEFYRGTHRHRTNRTLHIIGIPLILFGAIGLFAFSPSSAALHLVWWVSLAAFAVGWVLNLVGHAVYEKRAPAFSEDGLSFIAGPVWDLQQLLKRDGRRAA